MTTVRCTRCRAIKPADEFTPDPRKRNGRQSYCRECMYNYRREWTAKQPWKARAHFVRARGIAITAAQLEAAFDQQGGVCAVCGAEPGTRFLHADHDHDTGAFRAFLCSACNTSLGALGEDPVRIRALADYIEFHLANTEPPSQIEGDPQEVLWSEQQLDKQEGTGQATPTYVEDAEMERPFDE